MKVFELEKVLEGLDPDSEIRVYWDGGDRSTVEGVFLKNAESASDPENVVLVGEWACYEKPKNIIWGKYER